MISERGSLDHNGMSISGLQKEHITRYNELGIVMASMADFYEAGKSADPLIIKSLRKNSHLGVISSTTIRYQPSNLSGTIIHYHNSLIADVIVREVKIPVYDASYGVSLNAILADEQGLSYLQALFNTQDDPEEIKETLEKLSGKASRKIEIWTPKESARFNSSIRGTSIHHLIYNRFLVNGGGIGELGHSRGVSGNHAGIKLESISSNRWNTLEIDEAPCPPYQPKIEKSDRFQMLEIDG